MVEAETYFWSALRLTNINKIEEKFYRIVIRPIMTYGAEYWEIKKQHMYKMDVTKKGMLRWMCGKAKKDKIRNKHFQENLGVMM